MSTRTTPHAWTAGDDATSGYLQTLTTAIGELQTIPIVKMLQTVAQTIPNGVFTNILYDAHAVDQPSPGGHSLVTNTDKYFAQFAGWYLVTATMAWTANVTGPRWLRLNIQNLAVEISQINATTGTSVATVHGGSRMVYLNVGDFVALQGRQDSGSSLATSILTAAPALEIYLLSS